MVRRKYNILMKTPIGVRKGVMDVTIDKNIASGYLDILQHSQPFYGSIDENGYCNINGTIITLMRTIKYTAYGQIMPDILQLSVQGERNVFEITGTLSPKQE